MRKGFRRRCRLKKGRDLPWWSKPRGGIENQETRCTGKDDTRGKGKCHEKMGQGGRGSKIPVVKKSKERLWFTRAKGVWVVRKKNRRGVLKKGKKFFFPTREKMRRRGKGGGGGGGEKRDRPTEFQVKRTTWENARGTKEDPRNFFCFGKKKRVHRKGRVESGEGENPFSTKGQHRKGAKQRRGKEKKGVKKKWGGKIEKPW